MTRPTRTSGPPPRGEGGDGSGRHGRGRPAREDQQDPYPPEGQQDPYGPPPGQQVTAGHPEPDQQHTAVYPEPYRGPGYPAAPDPPRPTFTPRDPHPAQDVRDPHGRSAAQHPYAYDQAPREAQAPSERQAQRPTFTPHSAPPDPSRPQPTFTPREGYPPPPDRERRAAYPPPAEYLPPPGFQAPAFPQLPSFTPEPQRAPVPDRGKPGARRAGGARRRGASRPDPGQVREQAPGTSAARSQNTQPNLARSTQVMALGTLVSRATGFLRTFVFVAALGTGPLAAAYNNANTLPNTVYYLMLGGIFTSVVVPLLVKAAKNDPDRGEAYAERIFTMGAVALFVVTVVATAAAAPLVGLYAGPISGDERHLMVVFAYFFIPQIFFYGMDSLLGAILNTRGRFGANMWTPVINNVVVIVVGALFIVTEGVNKTPATISPAAVNLLGIGTTLGIVIQSIALFPVLRRAGFSMRPRFDIRRAEIREIRRMAAWMMGYVVSQWAGNLVVQRAANAASVHAPQNGYAPYTYGWSLFQLPYAVVGISVISALLPRMSGHATDRRYSLVREDFSTGVRFASVIVVPAAVFLAVLGPPLCEFLFSYGSTSLDDARFIGEVFGMFSLGLVPFMLTQLQLRVFYSFHDNRTPALIGVFMFAVNVAGALIALHALAANRVVVGLAAVYGLVTLTGAAAAWPLLLRRVGSLDGWRIARTLIRMFLATVPGVIFAFAVMAAFGSVLHEGRIYGLASTVIGGGGALMLYALCSRALGINEFGLTLRSVLGRFGR